MLTFTPEKWNHSFVTNMPDGSTLLGKLDKITNKADEVNPFADWVFLCLPAYMVEDTILRIKPYLNPNTILGSVVGNTVFSYIATSIYFPKVNCLVFKESHIYQELLIMVKK